MEINRTRETLANPAAQELLRSRIPARLAFTGFDGAPRVIPIWFHWNGTEIAMFTHAHTYKARAIAQSPRIAVSIDTENPPYRILTLRGTATVDPAPRGEPMSEANAATERYIGAEAAREFAKGKATLAAVRIAFVPEVAWLQEL